MVVTKAVHCIVCSSRDFRSGLVAGLSNNDRRYDLSSPVSESTVLDIVRSVCERACDDELTHERMLYECGLLVGYIVAAAQERR
jgi:hypothetical protein